MPGRLAHPVVRQFGVSLSPWINGLLLPGTEYLRGQRARLLLLERTLDTVFSRCDVVVQTRPIPFDILGLPLITFPIGSRQVAVNDASQPAPDGGAPRTVELPEGALLGGLPWAEDRLLSLAAAWQAVTDWHRRRPPVLTGLAPAGSGGRGDPPASRPDGRSPGGGSPRRNRLDVLDVWVQGQ